METEFGLFWILVSFSISPLALYLPIFVPCFMGGREKKSSLRSKPSTSPFISKITTTNSHTPRLGTLAFPSVLIVSIGVITEENRFFCMKCLLHLTFHHCSSGCLYSTHFSGLSLDTIFSIISSANISLTVRQYNLIYMPQGAICPSCYKEGSFKCAYT